SVLNRNYTITAEVTVPQDGEGMIVTEGGRFGGFGLYLMKGKPVYLYNLLNLVRFRWEGNETLAAGHHQILFYFKDDRPGFGKGGTGSWTVAGKAIASHEIPHTIPFLLNLGETMDVGVDTRTGVDDADYQPPFRFTGTIDKVTFKTGPMQLTALEQKQLLI